MGFRDAARRRREREHASTAETVAHNDRLAAQQEEFKAAVAEFDPLMRRYVPGYVDSFRAAHRKAMKRNRLLVGSSRDHDRTFRSTHRVADGIEAIFTGKGVEGDIAVTVGTEQAFGHAPAGLTVGTPTIGRSRSVSCP